MFADGGPRAAPSSEAAALLLTRVVARDPSLASALHAGAEFLAAQRVDDRRVIEILDAAVRAGGGGGTLGANRAALRATSDALLALAASAPVSTAGRAAARATSLLSPAWKDDPAFVCELLLPYVEAHGTEFAPRIAELPFADEVVVVDRGSHSSKGGASGGGGDGGGDASGGKLGRADLAVGARIVSVFSPL